MPREALFFDGQNVLNADLAEMQAARIADHANDWVYKQTQFGILYGCSIAGSTPNLSVLSAGQALSRTGVWHNVPGGLTLATGAGDVGDYLCLQIADADGTPIAHPVTGALNNTRRTSTGASISLALVAVPAAGTDIKIAQVTAVDGAGNITFGTSRGQPVIDRVTIDNVLDATTYTLTCGGRTPSYTSPGAGTTLALIRDGLIKEINDEDQSSFTRDYVFGVADGDDILLIGKTIGVDVVNSEIDANLTLTSVVASVEPQRDEWQDFIRRGGITDAHLNVNNLGELHRRLSGTGTVSPTNPHGLSITDLGAEAIVTDHQDVHHSNGIWEGSAANVLAATANLAGPDSVDYTNLIALDVVYVNGIGLDSPLASTNVPYTGSVVDPELNTTQFYETFITQDTGTTPILAKRYRLNFTTAPLTAAVAGGVQVWDVSPDFPTGAGTFRYVHAGTSISIQAFGDANPGPAKLLPTVEDTRFTPGDGGLVRLFSETREHWIDLYIRISANNPMVTAAINQTEGFTVVARPAAETFLLVNGANFSGTTNQNIGIGFGASHAPNALIDKRRRGNLGTADISDGAIEDLVDQRVADTVGNGWVDSPFRRNAGGQSITKLGAAPSLNVTHGPLTAYVGGKRWTVPAAIAGAPLAITPSPVLQYARINEIGNLVIDGFSPVTVGIDAHRAEIAVIRTNGVDDILGIWNESGQLGSAIQSSYDSLNNVTDSSTFLARPTLTITDAVNRVFTTTGFNCWVGARQRFIQAQTVNAGHPGGIAAVAGWYFLTIDYQGTMQAKAATAGMWDWSLSNTVEECVFGIAHVTGTTLDILTNSHFANNTFARHAGSVTFGSDVNFCNFTDLQDAINFVGAMGGGEIVVQPGEHALTAAVELRSGVHIRGVSAAAQITGAAGVNVLEHTSAVLALEDVTISDLTIVAQAGQNALEIVPTVNTVDVIKVRDVTFEGAVVFTPAAVNPTNLWLTNCVFDTSLLIQNSTAAWVKDCYFDSCDGAIALSVSNSPRTHIRGNVFEELDNTSGIAVNIDTNSADCHIVGNDFIGDGVAESQPINCVGDRCHIHGNSIFDQVQPSVGTPAGLIIIAAAASSCIISGNIISGITDYTKVIDIEGDNCIDFGNIVNAIATAGTHVIDHQGDEFISALNNIDTSGSSDYAIDGNSGSNGVVAGNLAKLAAVNNIRLGSQQISLGNHVRAATGANIRVPTTRDNCVVMGNVSIDGTSHGISSTSLGTVIAGNAIFNSGADGVLHDDLRTIVAMNCIIDAGAMGVDGSANAIETLVLGNLVYNATDEGIGHGGSLSGFVGNVIHSCGSHGIITSQSEQVMVGNHCFANSGDGIQTGGSRHVVVGNLTNQNTSNGIEIASNSSEKSVIIGNVAMANTAADDISNADNEECVHIGNVCDGLDANNTDTGAVGPPRTYGIALGNYVTAAGGFNVGANLQVGTANTVGGDGTNID